MAAKKKKADPVSVDDLLGGSRRASSVIRELAKKSGKLIKPKRRVGRIRTGILSLDYALGGGIPAGKIVTLFGERSGGKTTTALRMVAAAQQRCGLCLRKVEIESVQDEDDPEGRWLAEAHCDCVASGIVPMPKPARPRGMNDRDYKSLVKAYQDRLKENSFQEIVCLWLDIEDSFDPHWAECVGVDVNRLELIMPESAEEAIDTVTAALESRAFGMVVLDSVAQLVPDKEKQSTSEEWQQGLAARLLNKAFRKWVSAMRDAKFATGNENIPTLVLINQVRDKIGVMFGDPTTKPGGKGQEFAASVELRFLSSKIETSEESFGAKDKGEKIVAPTTEKIRFKVTKNRTASTAGVEGFYVQLNRGNDERGPGFVEQTDYVFKMLLKYAAEKKGGKYVVGGREFDSQMDLLHAIRFEDDFREAVCEVLADQILERSL